MKRSIDESIPTDAPISWSLRAAAPRSVSPTSSSIVMLESDSGASFSICEASQVKASSPNFLTSGINTLMSASDSTDREVSNSRARSEEPSLTKAASLHQVRVSFC